MGRELLDTLRLSDGYADELRLQALIAAEHVCAVAVEATDRAAMARQRARSGAHRNRRAGWGRGWMDMSRM